MFIYCMKKPDRNETPNKMSNATNVPPLTRSMCYLPEHYYPFLKHSDESNCPCSFCEHGRFVEAKEIEVAIKELPQIEALGRTVLEEEIQEEEILLQPASRSLEMPIPKLSRSTNDPSTWEAEEEEILLTGLRL